jgi:anti-sigma B factor antagonist
MVAEKDLNVTIRRISPYASVIDIQGEINSFSEKTLADAYAQAVHDKVHTIILNFTNLTYMNSLGMGMLVTLLIRAQRENKHLVAFGLNQHYRSLFSITRLDQVIPLYESEAVALARSERMDLPEREY